MKVLLQLYGLSEHHDLSGTFLLSNREAPQQKRPSVPKPKPLNPKSHKSQSPRARARQASAEQSEPGSGEADWSTQASSGWSFRTECFEVLPASLREIGFGVIRMLSADPYMVKGLGL